MSDILEMDWKGIHRVISGGQCGADLGALVAARQAGIETGGWAPKFWRTALGPNPILEDFGLVQHASANYRDRTISNVQDSDGTLVIASNFASVGTRLTINTCIKLGKPYYTVNLEHEGYGIIKWLNHNCIHVLNVAGNRDYISAGAHYQKAFEVMKYILAAQK